MVGHRALTFPFRWYMLISSVTDEQIGQVLSSGFLPSQVGSLATYIEPVTDWEPLDRVLRTFARFPDIDCIPVESTEGPYQVVTRQELEAGRSRFGRRIFGSATIRPYVSSSYETVDARQSVAGAIQGILSRGGQPQAHLLVFHKGRYFGVVKLVDLVRHAFGDREHELVRARGLQQYLVHRGDWNPPDYEVEILLDMAFELGGDFYYRQSLTPERDLIACFDVSGKNVSAALSTSLISAFFATVATMGGFPDDDDTSIVRALNGVLCRQLPPGMFVAALLIFYHRPQRKIFVYNLGYAPLFVVGAPVEVLPPEAPPLGIEEALLEGIEPQTIDRRDGLRLFSASDGMADAQNRVGTDFSDEGVLDSVTNAAEIEGGAEFLARLHHDVREHIGDAPRTDDITMICLDF